jgi:hypothetical protein
VTVILVAAGVAAALGAAVAVGAQGTRASVLGVLATLAFTPFVADPLPATLPAAFRIVTAVLAAFLLVVSARRAGPDHSSPLGLPAAVLAASAAFVAAFGATAVGLPSFGPAAALGAGLASLALAVGPIVLARDGFRLGVAAVVLLNGGLLVRAALAGTPPALESMLAGVALVAIAAAAATLTGAVATAAGNGALPPAARRAGGMDVPPPRT